MQIGFATLIGVEPTPFEELVAWSGANDLRALEVNVGPGYRPIGDAPFPGHLDIPAIVATGGDQVQAVLDQHGVRIASLAPMMNLLSADLELREKRIAYMRQTIQAAQILGVDTVVTFTGSAYGMHFYGTPGVGDGHSSNHVADNLRIFTEVYTPLAEFAGEHGVRIAFETAGRGGPEGNLAHSPELWDAMFEAVPSPALGLSLDPSHLVWLHIPNISDVIREFGSRIYHFDGKDVEILRSRLARQGILGSGWWRYRLPGVGELDWRDIFSALVEVGYDGVIAIENEDPIFPGREAVAWSAAYLRGLLPPGAGRDATLPPI